MRNYSGKLIRFNKFHIKTLINVLESMEDHDEFCIVEKRK